MNGISCVLAATAVLTLGSYLVLAQNTTQANPMSFFITSVGPGNGANLGGLAGADQHCETLAKAAGFKPDIARALHGLGLAAGRQGDAARAAASER